MLLSKSTASLYSVGVASKKKKKNYIGIMWAGEAKALAPIYEFSRVRENFPLAQSTHLDLYSDSNAKPYTTTSTRLVPKEVSIILGYIFIIKPLYFFWTCFFFFVLLNMGVGYFRWTK